MASPWGKLRTAASNARWFVINTVSAARRGAFGKPSGQFVYFDLISNPYDRYLALLFRFFEISGYTVVVRFRFRFLGQWATSLALRQCRSLRLTTAAPAAVLTVTNDPVRAADFDFYLSHDYFGRDQSGHFVPMPMVDSFYEQGLYRETESLQFQSNRPVGIFFAGRFRERHYNRPEVGRFFGCFTRTELLARVQSHYSDRLQNLPAANERPAKRGLVIVDRDRANIKPTLLYQVLSNSNFFLAFPGVVMPLCHNVIEAMAFGCIPVLQYANLFHPPLQHGVHCIGFSDEPSLTRAIDMALTMEEEEIERMRSHVITYYNHYLAPQAAVDQILKSKGREKRLVLNAEYQSVRYLMAGKKIQQPS